MSSIASQMQQLSLDEPQVASTTVAPQPATVPPQRRSYRRRNTNPTQVNPRPLPTSQECRAARKRCMYYGFYAGELALQKMLIRCFPEELEGRDPSDINLFLAAIEFVRDLTNRADIRVHVAYVSQRNKDAIPSIGAEVGEPTYILGLFPLEKEAYMNRITQENVDMLVEFLGMKPSWWEIAQFSDL